MDSQVGMLGGMQGGADLILVMLRRLEQHPARRWWWENFMPREGREAHRQAETPGCGYYGDLPLLQQLLCSCLLCSCQILSSKRLNG